MRALGRQFGLEQILQVAADTDRETSFQEALAWHTGRSSLQLHDAWKDYLVYGSGAWWRVLLDQCFNALLILAVPVLAVAWWRRRRRARQIGARLEWRQRVFPHEFDLDPTGREDADSPATEDEKAARERGGEG